MAVTWVLLSQEYGRRTLERERIFMERKSALEVYDDLALIRKFRFPKVTILELIDTFRPILERSTKRSQAIPAHTQVLAALRFYAKGVFQEDSGDIVGISQPSVSRCVKSVTSLLCELVNVNIKFPETDLEVSQSKLDFFKMQGFPNVIGVIDGTHIMLRPPAEDEPLFVCRKGGHSINVQIICDARMMIRSIVSKWPGSTHDAFIWKNCTRRDVFIQNPPNGWLLGDSGYALEPWLITPFEKPSTESEVMFNIKQKKTRFIVENCIGLWKSVFRCIDKTGGKLLYSAENVSKIIMATAVLHNIRRKLRLPEDEEFELEYADEDNEVCLPNMQDNQITVAGNEIRKQLVNYFA